KLLTRRGIRKRLGNSCSMRRRIVWVVIGVPSALIIIGAGAAFSLPITRHMISGLWNNPDRLPTLSTNGQVHYQPAAEDFARDVAALYPDALRGLKPCMVDASRILLQWARMLRQKRMRPQTAWVLTVP